METYIDLHTHSNCSDGTLTPEELVSYAKEKNLSSIALTDHDTINGIARAKEAADKVGIELICGVEFSTSYMDKDIHILGYDFDEKSSRLKKHIQDFQDSRRIRNEKIIKKLRQEKVAVSLEELKELFPSATITRAHIGKYLLLRGYAKNMADAFDRYLGDNAPCFVPREKVTPQNAVSVIHECGGYAVLAHPLRYGLSHRQLESLLSFLNFSGLDGLEALYSTHSSEETEQMKELAGKYGLAITGGSDFHGFNKPQIDLGSGRGDLKIPSRLLSLLRERPPRKSQDS